MKRRKIIIRAEAEAEIDEIAQYLAEDHLQIGLRFYDSIDETFRFLSQAPLAGRPRIARDPTLEGLRSWPMKHFSKYLVFYLVGKSEIDILHVIHGSRDLPRRVGVKPPGG